MAFGIIKADTLTHSTAGSVDTNYVVEGSAKAWSISGLDDTTIDDSFNTASQTDHGTGKPSYAFTNSFVNINHADVGLIGNNSAHIFYNGGDAAKSSSTTGNFRLYDTGNTHTDSNFINVISIGDLA